MADACDRQVDEVVRRATVTDDDVAAMGLHVAFDELLRGVFADATVSADADRPRRWRRRLVAGVAGAIVLGTAGAAAAGVYQAHTGQTMTEAGSSSELLDVTAPDFLTVARQYEDEVPFAPGYSAELYWGILLSPGGIPQTEELSMSTDGVRSDIRTWASCSWQRTWLSARSAGDTATQANAAAHIETLSVDPLLARFDSFQPRYAAAAAAHDDPGPIETSVTMACPVPTPVVTR